MAAAFLVAQADRAIGMHPCPVHGEHHAPAAAAPDSHLAHQDDSPREPGATCTCLGACQIGAAVALGTQPTGPGAAPLASFQACTAAPVSAPRLHFAHALPYSTAPPVRS